MINHFRQFKRILNKSVQNPVIKDSMLTLEDIIPSDSIPIGTSPAFLGWVLLEDSVREDTDFFILERLKIISLKDKWDINEATLAVKSACLKEWYRRHGEGANIPDIDLSKEALDQLAAEKEYWFDKQ
jgi:hypothetical protein